MNLANNKQELKAIFALEKAFLKCSKLGIKFSVMDSGLHFANKRLLVECEKIAEKEAVRTNSGAYPSIAYAQDTELKELPTVDTHKAMMSSGAW